MEKLNILCIGGDARMIYMCEYLTEYGQVFAYRTKARPRGAVLLEELTQMTDKADLLILPMLNSLAFENGEPVLNCSGRPQRLSELFDCLKDSAVITGGLADEKTAGYFRERGYELTDYFKREELIVKNCIPTAEGALLLAMQEQAETVFGSRVLITGFGNVAKAAARLFSAAGADVTCAVRRTAAEAQALSCGYKAVYMSGLSWIVSDCDIIINTVPAVIIGKDLLERLSSKALIIDLASKPGGVDIQAAEKLRVRYLHAPGLPGKVAPVTAGRYIAETVVNIMSERRI